MDQPALSDDSEDSSPEAIHERRRERLYWLCKKEMALISLLYKNEPREVGDKQIAAQNSIRRTLGMYQRERIHLGSLLTASEQEEDAYLLTGIMETIKARYQQHEQESFEHRPTTSASRRGRGKGNAKTIVRLARVLTFVACLLVSLALALQCVGSWQRLLHNVTLPESLALTHSAHDLRGDGSQVYQQLNLIGQLVRRAPDELAQHLPSSIDVMHWEVTKIEELQSEFIATVYIEPATRVSGIAEAASRQSQLTSSNHFSICSDNIRFLQHCTLGIFLLPCELDHLDAIGQLARDHLRDAHKWHVPHVALLHRIARQLHHLRDYSYEIHQVLMPAATKEGSGTTQVAEAAEVVVKWAERLDQTLFEADLIVQDEAHRMQNSTYTSEDAAQAADEIICGLRALSQGSRVKQLNELMWMVSERESAATSMAAEMMRRQTEQD
nr:hypothetical protein CFP56_69050 [Quercus suber]